MWMRSWLTTFAVVLACAVCPGVSAAANAPTTNFDPETHSQSVYFEGPDGSLREMAWTAASGWSPVYVIAPAGSLGSAPATNFDPEYHSQNVYFAGEDGALREISWTPASGWSQPSVLTPGGGVIAPAPPPAPTPPAPTPPASASRPTGTGSVTLTPPRRKHKLAVKIVMKWRWNHGHTRLLWVKIGRAPGRTVFSISCDGRGCPARRVHASVATLHRHPRALRGKLYRAGDRLLVSLTAPSWKAERARIRIRSGRVPFVRLL
jgi:hypothetical protein